MWCCSDVHASVFDVIPAQAGIHCAVGLARHPGASRDPVLLLFVPALIVSMVGRAFALARESLFFACAKKSNQKKAHPGGTPFALCATGSQAGSEFSEGTSVCRPKTARIVRAALRVYPATLAVPQGPRRSKSGSNGNGKIKGSPPPQSLVAPSISPALRAREEAGSNGRVCRVRTLPFPVPRSPFPASP